jgi:hypothetical protein
VVGGKESVTDLGFLLQEESVTCFSKEAMKNFDLFFFCWSLSPVSLNLFWTIDNQTDIM